jgi:hypothetical protein
MRGCTSMTGLLLAIALPVAIAHAGPPSEPGLGSRDDEPARDRGAHVIPPGREAQARELLAPVLDATAPELRWLGPTIEIDRIKWWLLRGEQARAMLVLVPRELGAPDDPISRSFAIQAAWAPDIEPEPHEQQLLAAAIESVRAHDRGQFYRVRLDVFEADGPPPPPYWASEPADPRAVHRRWGLELSAVALLGLLALGVTFRRRPAPTG